jgi:hypothetical protein
MNVALRFALAAVTALSLTACESGAMKSSTITKVASTTSFGMCAGYCKTTLEISEKEAVLTREAWGRGAGANLPLQRFATPLGAGVAGYCCSGRSRNDRRAARADRLSGLRGRRGGVADHRRREGHEDDHVRSRCDDRGSAAAARPRASAAHADVAEGGVSAAVERKFGAARPYARRTKPSALHSSLPTPWCTMNIPSGSYFAFTARSFG